MAGGPKRVLVSRLNEDYTEGTTFRGEMDNEQVFDRH
jgi:hypothetical protein